ncbi:hypothetical protein FH972_022607 [Carpinus fangiana]|uniref:Mitochondrial carrier n=1 Tax=Carpinus fangiana TaxID=176857 RepID=A0A5N6KUZ6_9ROSI|nr:hypothetical protein FH972_022607 [Carpinus fangiana]
MADTHKLAGQSHDRIPSPPIDNEPELPVADGSELSMGIKMLSAVTGSVLTSLLVTPLDVVRVRLQSQQPSKIPTPTTLSNTASSLGNFTNLPPNLGVTACCREVFWVNNNAPFCVAADANVAYLGNSVTTSAVTSPSSSNGTLAPECAVEETQRRTFTSTIDGLRKIARNEGFTTLWRGLSPTLVMAVPANVIYFAGYDWLRTSPRSPMHNRVSDTYAPLAAGSAARVLAAIVVSPIELFRTRMQAHHSPSATSNFRETMTGVREMVASEGTHTLWRGLSLTLWRDVPFSALYWWGYESTRNIITDIRGRAAGEVIERTGSIARRRSSSRSRQNHTTTLVDSFTAGAVSGFAASVVTTPFDVGKTRQQVLKHSGDSAKAAASDGAGVSLRPEDRSMPRFLLHIFREEGMAGLFRGCAARCMKVAPACAIMISSYELGKKMAAGVQKDHDDRV